MSDEDKTEGSTLLSVLVSEDFKSKLRDAAADERRSLSDFVRVTLEDALSAKVDEVKKAV